MSGGSILDMMVQDHVVEEKVKVERRIASQRVAGDLERERREVRQKTHEAEWRDLERRAAEQAARQVPEIAGLREGMQFEMKNCGPGVDGVWRVVRVDKGAAGDASRRLWGQRVDGGPGYLPLTERKALDALHMGAMKILG